MKYKALVLSFVLLFVSTCVFASGAGTHKKPVKKAAATKCEKAASSADVQQLKEKLAAAESKIDTQQGQIDQLQRMLKQSIEAIQAQKSEVESAATKADSAKEQASQANTELTSVKSLIATTSDVSKSTAKRVEDLEHPTVIRYKGITLQPGGFLETTYIARSRNENADVANSYGGAPLDGTSNANLSEFRATARASRMTLLATGKAGKIDWTGYYEMDFLGAGPTSNQVQTNAFLPRLRQAWGQVQLPGGWTVSAGQYWTLLTTNRKGAALRAEFIPNVSDGNYAVGFNFVRQTAVRVAKTFSPVTTAAFEVANSEQTYATAYMPANVQGLNSSPNAVSGVLLSNYLAGYSTGNSTNVSPDLIGKVAFDPKYGHYEIKALGRIFRDRVAGTTTTVGTSNVSYGGGIGFGAILPVVPKKVDVIVEGLYGRGIGRYATGSMPDVTVHPLTAKLLPLRAAHFLAGIEVHPTPRFDVYAYGGNEYTWRYDLSNISTGTGTGAGYGSHLAAYNTACNRASEVTMNSCSGSNRDIYEITGGFWYRFYKGPFGTLQYGNQLAYFHRSLWSGVGTTPTGQDVVGYTTLRFYLP